VLEVSQIHLIRHKILVDGKSIRQVAKEMEVSRNTVRKYVREGRDGSPRDRKPRVAPARELIAEPTRELLEAWESRTTAKQRVTATLLHGELRAQGHDVGLTTVREVLREHKRAKAESFIPLIYRPGEVGQVDFFEVYVDIKGERRKAFMFLMRLMYSGRDFAWLCERQDQVCFLDAHVRAFAHLGGIPQRVVYDNLKPAVKKVLRKGRELTRDFAALAAHYAFEPCFARPGEGHDKGGVESRGKNIRLQLLTPVPRGETLDEVSEQLLARLDADAQTKICRTRGPIAPRFEEERRQFIELPPRPYDARRVITSTASSTSRVRAEGAHYSVWSRWRDLTVTVLIGPTEVEIRCRGESVVHPRMPFNSSSIQYKHYFVELRRKPQAVRQLMPELLRELGEPFAQLWRVLVDLSGPMDAARAFARVLGAVVDTGEQAVRRVIERALKQDRIDLLDLSTPVQVPDVVVPQSLRGYEVESASVSDFDHLLGGAS
jgi:transposase